MDSITGGDRSGSASTPSRRRPSRPSTRWGAGPMVVLVEGVLAGVGGVYLATASVLITLVASAAAVVMTALVLMAQR